MNFRRWYVSSVPSSLSMMISLAVTSLITPAFLARTTEPESTAALYSMPVATIGDSDLMSGTA